MKRLYKQSRTVRREVEVFNPDPEYGLTQEQVLIRREAGWAAGKPRAAGKTRLEIVLTHLFTFFNLVFAVLGVLLMLAGSSPKNMTFLMVAAWNAVIGIVQELRAKRAVDNLTLVAARPVTVVRQGQRQQIPAEETVRDEIALVSPGDTLSADGVLRSGELQVDESLLTGEADPVRKVPGDPLRSGSAVLTGHGSIQLTAVGEDAYAARLTAAAKDNPRAAKSEMMRSLDKLIRVVGFALVPVGLVLFHQEYRVLHMSLQESAEGTVAALVGMIPEGLYLLTSIAMAASALKLSRDRVLVQDMNCIESLARVDVLCVDKTGTVTENYMEVEALVPLKESDAGTAQEILSALYGSEADNDTARAMAARFGAQSSWIPEKRIPFSSAYKWSGGVFRDRGAFLAGAPEVLLQDALGDYAPQLDSWADQGYRVILLAAYGGDPVPGQLEKQLLTPLAFCLLSSPLRENAKDTFAYFARQGVSVRVISGDNPRTVSRVAQQAGIEGADRYIDASTLETQEDYARAAEEYRVFGRVTPEQKQKIVQSLQAMGHTVGMTGDGVNDLLAMKQADCSVAMASGTQAASQMASLVLLDSDFAAMPAITAEGRRVINNIQRAATLFLVKNIFSLFMSILTICTGWSYPLQPIHLTVISSLTIGIPSFFLAMEPNYSPIRGRFLRGVLRRAFPGGLTNIFVVTAVQIYAGIFGLTDEQTATVCAGVLGITGLMVLFQVCKPFKPFRKLVWTAMAAAMVVCFTLLGNVFDLRTGTAQSNMAMFTLMMMVPTVFIAMLRLFDYGDKLYLYLRGKYKD